MRLLFVADLHYTLKQFDWLLSQASSYDAVAIGGDLLDLSSPLDFDVQIAVVERYLERIRSRTSLIVSSGNHDGDARNDADESIALWLKEIPRNGIFVDGDSVMFGDTLVTICAWWDGPVSKGEVEAQLARDAAKPKKRWIWIHHAPPSETAVCWSGKKELGDQVLLTWIKNYHPDAVLSGHVHLAPFYTPRGSWVDQHGSTWVFNPGRQIGSEPTSIILDLESMTVEWSATGERASRQLTFADVCGAEQASA